MNRAPTRILVALVALGLGLSAVGVSAVGAPATDDPEVTYVESDVTEDTTWTAEGGPYRVAADVTVESGATLRVEPGATIQPAADITITVEGNLTADGTAADPVTVATAPQAPDDVRWATIRYAGTSESRLSLDNVTLTNATNALTLDSSAGRVDVSAVTVRNVARNGVRVVNATGAPELTVADSTFADVGGRAVAVTPGTGAVGDWRITANSTRHAETTEHQARLTLGADTTMDTFRVAYHGHGKVDEVTNRTLRRFGLDLHGDDTIDRSLRPRIERVGPPNGTANAFEVRLANPVTVPAGATVVAKYGNVVNPRTYGTYPVSFGFRLRGVDQTAATTLPFDLRSSGERPRADRYSEPSRARGISITGSTFEDVGEQGVFVAADAARRIRLAGNTFTDTRGSAVALRGPRVDSVAVAGNRVSAVGTDADGVRIAAQRATDLTLRGNRVSGADAGVGLYARNENVDRVRFVSNAVTDSTTGLRVRYGNSQFPSRVSLTLAGNAVSNNDRRGISVETSSARLRGVAVRGNEITDNGATGLHVDGPVVARSRVRNNVVESNGGHGVRVEAARLLHSTVRNNTVAENRGHGLSLWTKLVVHNVSVDANRALDNAGVGVDVDSRLTHAGVANLTRNVVAANAYGVRLAGAFGGRVSNNTVVYNTYGVDSPVRLSGYRPGTGIVVEEGDAGAIFRTGDVSEELATLIDDPQVEAVLDDRYPDEYTVVLRPGKEGYVRTGDAAALTVRSLSEDIPTGVVLRKDGERTRGIAVRHNDVYGHRRGMTVNVSTLVDANTTTRLLVNATRTVAAEENYWGAETGPTHASIHPEGTGDLVVTRRGWVDFVPAASSPFGPRRHRPVANITVSPNPATVGERVVVSGRGSSDADGRVATYRFAVEGPNATALTGPNATESAIPQRTVSFDAAGTYNVSLVVEDETGVESAAAASATVSVRRETTTAAPETPATGTETTGENGNSSADLPSNADSGFLPPLAVFGTVGGFLGLAFYGSGLLLGAYGAFLSVRRAGAPVGGRTINGLAAAGVLVWVGSGLFGTDGLFALGVGAGGLWLGLVVALWAVTRLLYD